MAILDKMPNKQIIDGFKHTVDFYEWKGIPCARKWPAYHFRVPTAAELANQMLFKEIVDNWKLVDPVTRQMYQAMAQGTGLTARDVYVRASMKGLYRYPLGP